MPKRPTKTARTAPITLDGVFADGLEGLSTFVTHAKDTLSTDPSDSDLASVVATTLTKIAQVQAEHRKAEAAKAKRLDAITVGVVLSWFRTLDANEQGQVIREMQNIGSKRSGLA